MTTLGIAVSFPPAAKGKPVVACAILDGTRRSPKLIESFDLRTSADAPVDQLQDLAKALSSKISGLSLSGVVVRIADFAPVASRRAATATRLLIEGALLLVCRNHVADVHVRSGKVIAETLGVSKKDLNAIGSALDAKRPDAVAAAESLLQEGN